MDKNAPENLPTETPEQPSPQTKQRREEYGVIAAVAVIVILIVLGGYYIWDTKIRNGDLRPAIEDTAQEDETLMELERQQSSDDLSSIETDLQATDLDAIDRELSDIETQIESEGL